MTSLGRRYDSSLRLKRGAAVAKGRVARARRAVVRSVVEGAMVGVCVARYSSRLLKPGVVLINSKLMLRLMKDSEICRCDRNAVLR